MDSQNKNNFRKLLVWQKSKELTILIYETTVKFPSEEKFAMVPQMRRSAYSIMANIAEGNSKLRTKDKCNFFNIAQGSLNELDSFCELAFELRYIDKEKYEKILELINKTGYLLV